MTDTSNTALGLSRLLLRILIVLNVLGGVLLVCAFVASFPFSQVLVDYCAQNGFDAGILIPAVRIWLVQVFHLLFFVMVRIAAVADADIDWDFSLNGWLAVLLAFVLAKVFEHGARLRDDLGAII